MNGWVVEVEGRGIFCLLLADSAEPNIRIPIILLSGQDRMP